MTAKLIQPGEGAQQPREILMSRDEFLIGRGVDCDFSILESEVSRHHCLIRVVGREATIRDLGSSNGTYVNDQRTRSQTTIKTGDRIQVGSASFVVDLGDTIEFTPGNDAPDPGAITIRRKKPMI